MSRQAPTPKQRSAAAANEPPSSWKAKYVSTSRVWYGGAMRRFVSSGYGSETLPGFILPSGSQIALNSRNASTSSGPNIRSSSSARACPSPCSPESEPPYDATSAAASSMNAR